MNNNIILPSCKNVVGRTLFYIFEISALIIGVITLIIAIYNAAISASFMVFISTLVSAVIRMLSLYALGKIIDLLYLRKEETRQETKVNIKKEEK